MLAEEGKLREAARAYAELLAINPRHLKARNNLGFVYGDDYDVYYVGSNGKPILSTTASTTSKYPMYAAPDQIVWEGHPLADELPPISSLKCR